MSKTPIRAGFFATVCIASAFILAGCLTVADMQRISALHPQSPEIRKSVREPLDRTFPRELLPGKWEGWFESQELLWCHDRSRKKFPINGCRTVYEFRKDGSGTVKDFRNGIETGSKEFAWTYSVGHLGHAELTLEGLAQPCWTVFWYGENEIALAHRNGDIAGKFYFALVQKNYGPEWTSSWLYNRDACLNEKVIVHNIKGNVGYRREIFCGPRVMKRVGGCGSGTPSSAAPAAEDQGKRAEYEIVSCERESGMEFAYRFVLELKGAEKTLHIFRSVQKEFREALKQDYSESFPGVDRSTLYVEFPEYRLDDGKIEGRAVVLTVSVTAMTYDPNTRKGKLAVKVNANQYEEARKWVRKNIETLARDKNIALTTGEIPPAARFYLGREELKEGDILEVEFRTE